MSSKALLLTALFLYMTTLNSIEAQMPSPKDTLRDALVRSLREPAAIQYVTFGPLKNNKIYQFKINYHNEYGSVHAKKQSKNDQFFIEFPRRRILRTPIIADAMLGCVQSRHLCEKMEDYLDKVDRASSIESIPFFDDAFPDSADVFRALREAPVWREALRASLESATLVVVMHEISHSILDHFTGGITRDVDILRQEAEADGCVLALLKLTGLSGVGGLAFLADVLLRQEKYGEFDFSHPKPRCRLVALSQQAIDWFGQNEESIQKEIDPSFGWNIPRHSDLMSTFSKALGSVDKICESYMTDVLVGYRKGLTLFDQNTKLDSVP